MPQKANHVRTPVRVDVYNNFYRLDTVTGAYVPMTVALQKKIAISHVQTYLFDTEATIAIDDGSPGATGREHIKAKPGDMLIIWSDGKHKIVPPAAQKWIRDLVPNPILVAGDNPPPDIPPGPDLAAKK